MPAVGERKVSIEKEGGKVLNSSEEIKKKSNTEIVTYNTYWSKYLFSANRLKDVVLSSTSE